MSVIVVQELIQYLNDIFPNIHYSLTHPYSYYRDACSYYLFGHCASFARILNAIFPNNSELYVSSSHVLVKIDNYFYDVCGLVVDVKLSDYRYSEIDDYYMRSVLNKEDLLERKLEDILIQLGKTKLYDLMELHTESLNY